MSPVARRQANAHTGKAVLVAFVGVAIAFGAAWAAVNYSTSSDNVEIRLGDDRFEAGVASRIANDIDKRGAPLAFADVATGRRPIWLDHLGTTDDTGWVAFGAFLPDDPTCSVNWTASRDLYVADCDDAITFPRDGTGLRAFPVTVEIGRLFVDLRVEPADAP